MAGKSKYTAARSTGGKRMGTKSKKSRMALQNNIGSESRKTSKAKLRALQARLVIHHIKKRQRKGQHSRSRLFVRSPGPPPSSSLTAPTGWPSASISENLGA